MHFGHILGFECRCVPIERRSMDTNSCAPQRPYDRQENPQIVSKDERALLFGLHDCGAFATCYSAAGDQLSIACKLNSYCCLHIILRAAAYRARPRSAWRRMIW